MITLTSSVLRQNSILKILFNIIRKARTDSYQNVDQNLNYAHFANYFKLCLGRHFDVNRHRRHFSLVRFDPDKYLFDEYYPAVVLFH